MTKIKSDHGVDVPSTFAHLLKSEPEVATAVAAIKTLILVLEKCAAKTLQELIKLLKEACDQMKSEVDCSTCSVTSGCELFLRFITLASKLEEHTFEAMRAKMLEKGNVFLEKMMTAREKIAKKGAERLPDGAVNTKYLQYLIEVLFSRIFPEDFGTFSLQNCTGNLEGSP